jgi:tripartite-type tricarboxylate transporter receptor subunit TctC
MSRALFAAFAAVLAWATPVAAQDWPTRPVTMVVPFAAGGPTDVLGRVMAQRLTEILGQRVVVENVTGAGGMIGAQRVAQGPKDGSQFVLGTVGTHAVNQTLYRKPAYDAAADFEPVALIADLPLILITRRDLAVNSLQDFIAYVRANQDRMTYGSAGTGSATHLGCLLLNSVLGTKVEHVPYRGSSQALQDLTGGRIDFMCDISSTALPQIQGSAVKAIAVLAPGRLKMLQNVPTADEQGLKGFEAYTWNAFFLPRGTPEAIVRKLHDATVEAMNSPQVRERLESLGAGFVSPERATPEYLGGFVRSEIEKWAAPIRASGVVAD